MNNLAIANRLREVLLDGHWIANTNFKELIKKCPPFPEHQKNLYLFSHLMACKVQ